MNLISRNRISRLAKICRERTYLDWGKFSNILTTDVLFLDPASSHSLDIILVEDPLYCLRLTEPEGKRRRKGLTTEPNNSNGELET